MAIFLLGKMAEARMVSIKLMLIEVIPWGQCWMVWKGVIFDKTQWNILTLSTEAREGQRIRNDDISFI